MMMEMIEEMNKNQLFLNELFGIMTIRDVLSQMGNGFLIWNGDLSSWL